MLASDLVTCPTWRDTAPTFRLLGGGHFWETAVQAGHLIEISRTARTMAGPKAVKQFVQPNQPVYFTRPLEVQL